MIPIAAPAIAMPTNAPVEIPELFCWVLPLFGAFVGAEVALFVTVRTVDLGEPVFVDGLVAMLVEEELPASPTLPGPFVEPSRAVAAFRFVGGVMPVRPLMLNLWE